MRTLTAGLLLTVALTAMAEPRTLRKQVVCDTTVKVLSTITEEFEETPQWQGQNAQQMSQIMLTVNLTTGAWTIVEYTADTACVLAVGENASSRWGIPI
jgi:hypothetical protein